jgi:putative zinc finger/helix-turn-helix YgiT family protein
MEDRMKCLSCGGSMTTKREAYKYAESGLSCVTLLGMEVSRCAGCGESEVAIPAIEVLHRAIVRVILLKPERLVPEEIRFLRKHLGLLQAELAAHLGVAVESVSRWESGKQQMDVPTDKLLRMLAARKEPVGKYERELPNVAVRKAKCSRIGMQRKGSAWRVQPAA